MAILKEYESYSFYSVSIYFKSRSAELNEMARAGHYLYERGKQENDKIVQHLDTNL